MGLFNNSKDEKNKLSQDNNPINPIDDSLAKFEKILVDIDKLKNGMEANSELRQLYTEKFSWIDEQIGELKNMLINQEKDMSRIEVAATKASDLVSEVQPEALLSEVKKNDSKIEGVKDKLESYHDLSHTIMEELKNIKRAVKIFRGVDDVRNMLKDAHKDLTAYEKIEGAVESRSDKIETIYGNFLKNLDEFKNFKDSSIIIHKKVENHEKEFNQIKESNKESNKELIKRSEFNEFSTKLYDFVNVLEKKLGDVNFSMNFIDDLKELVSSLESELGNVVLEINNIKKKVVDKTKIYEVLDDYSERIKNSDLEKSLVKEKIKNLEKNVEKKLESIPKIDFKNFEERLLHLEQFIKELDENMSDFVRKNDYSVSIPEMKEKISNMIKNDDQLFDIVKELENKVDNIEINKGQVALINEMDERINILSQKLVESQERETKMIKSVQHIIDSFEKIKKRV